MEDVWRWWAGRDFTLRLYKAMNKTVLGPTLAAFLCIMATSIACAQQAFKNPDDAARALIDAARTGDRKALVTVLGGDGEVIVSSGDDVADATTRQKLIAAYDAKHQVLVEGDRKPF